ncbi:hypothetical protein BdWA1_001111 [Babesia duncani]|uniref:Uncharacterized protein n=1 Tax=Babesia duncani TaxID=323732 RepID=A0AAD9PNI3_9APIC|nr:hypothetical protein BdWA1_001111 [Babesia duncani]
MIAKTTLMLVLIFVNASVAFKTSGNPTRVLCPVSSPNALVKNNGPPCYKIQGTSVFMAPIGLSSAKIIIPGIPKVAYKHPGTNRVEWEDIHNR